MFTLLLTLLLQAQQSLNAIGERFDYDENLINNIYNKTLIKASKTNFQPIPPNTQTKITFNNKITDLI